MSFPVLHHVQTRDGAMLTPRYDRYVTPSLDVYGEYSPEERRLLTTLAPPGGVVVQVGANVGALTLPLAHAVGREGRVFALEPQPVLFKALTANLALNNLWHVEAKQVAAGAMPGVTYLPDVDYQQPGNFGGLSTSDTPSTVRVSIVTLDAALKDLPRCDLLHLDCEGAELAALEGAAGLLRRLRPVLYVEVDRPAVRDGLPALLAQHDYVAGLHAPLLFAPDNWRGVEKNIFADESGTALASFNALCVPAERRATFATLLDQLPPFGAMPENNPRGGMSEADDA
jgi:FkbM family methyltransferase